MNGTIRIEGIHLLATSQTQRPTVNGPHVHFIVNPQVRDADPDIIAFQEVRSSETSEDENQVAELNEILGQYQHHLFVSADKVIAPDKLYKTGWEIEGAN